MTLRQDLRRGGQMHRSSHGSKPSDGELRQCPASCTSILKMYRLRAPIVIWDRDSGRLESDVRAGALMPASWNQIVCWLQQIDGLRRPA
jgi:hypothetical protein